MLKRRLIPVLNIMNGLIVRSEDFSIHQNIGNVINEAHRYNDWDVDELIYLDISRSSDYDLRRDDHKIKSYNSIGEIIQRISEVCFMPLTFGGGIRAIEDVDVRIANGADKVAINTIAIEKKDFITTCATKYGSQCVVVSVDYKIINDLPYVFSHFGKINTGINLFEWAKEIQEKGAGEIFVNSIDRDGKGEGFDISIFSKLADELKIPVIACGGCGTFDDFIDLAQKTKVSAMAAGNIFHFTENAYPRAKKAMKRENINVR